MAFFGLLHHHPGHRARQLRWVLPLLALVLVAVLATLAVQYQVSNQSVGREFFRAHKTITHTGELLQRGMVIGSAVLTILVLAVALWAFRLTLRIVRPVHALHRALEALVAGDLGVRVELHRDDEFREMAEVLNRLVDEFASTMAKVHETVERPAAVARGETEPETEAHPQA